MNKPVGAGQIKRHAQGDEYAGNLCDGLTYPKKQKPPAGHRQWFWRFIMK